jgi:hypothetical protein
MRPADPLLTGGSVAIVAAFTVAHITVSPAENFDSVSSFRYWADGLEIADAGRVPTHTVQWGVEQVPTVSKVALNAFDAGVSLLTAGGPLAPMRALTVLSAVGVAAALLALGRELGMRAGAVVLTGVALMVPASLPAPRELSNDLDVFRAESFGRLAACCGLLLALRCVRGHAGRPVMAAAAATFAVAALTHLVPALIALAALAALALLERGPAPSRSRRLGKAAAIAAAAAAIWAGALVAAAARSGSSASPAAPDIRPPSRGSTPRPRSPSNAGSGSGRRGPSRSPLRPWRIGIWRRSPGARGHRRRGMRS